MRKLRQTTAYSQNHFHYVAPPLLCLLLMGCESKISQCGKVQAVITKEKSVLASANPNALASTASGLDAITQELEAVKIGDGNLQNLQKNLINVNKIVSESIRNTSIAINKIEPKNIRNNLKDLEQVSEKKQVLIDEISRYCVSK